MSYLFEELFALLFVIGIMTFQAIGEALFGWL